MSEKNSWALLSSQLCPWLREPYGRLEQAYEQGRLGHAWLIHGKSGTGKLNLCLYFAATLLGAHRDNPPPELSLGDFLIAMEQRSEKSDMHADIHWVRPEEDKATIGVEQIRDVCDTMVLKSYASGPKVVVVEPAEAMTTAAANALLKTLEEPRGQSVLLLVSHRPGTLPATVRSRCQRLRIRPTIDDSAQSPLDIARNSTAAAAESIKTLAAELTAIIDRSANPLSIAEQWAKQDTDHILGWLSGEIQAFIRAKTGDSDSTKITESSQATLHNVARGMPLKQLIACYDEAEALRNRIGSGINVQLGMRSLLLGFRPQKE